MSRVDDLLVDLDDVLRKIEHVLAFGKRRYDSDEMVRFALERLWISTGNLAEQYRLAAGLPDGAEPWTELYVYRCILAHALPDELSSERIWDESLRDLERLKTAVMRERGSAGSR